MKRLFLTVLIAFSLLGPVQAAEINDLNTTDASNTARFPENMAPSAVNNGARALEGLIARWNEDIGCRKSSTGSANAYVFAAAQTLGAYYDGLVICYDANFGNTGAATVNVDTLGAKTIKKHNDQDLASGDIETGQKVLIVYDGTNFQLISQVANAPSADASPDSLITTRGDIIYGNSGAAAARLAVGAAGTVFRSDGTDPAWTDVAASQAELETASSTTVFASPGRQHFHPSAAKGWAVFQVDGTVLASYNVTSVTDNGIGDWTVNWGTNFSSANYVSFGMPLDGAKDGNVANAVTAQTAGTTRFYLSNEAGGGDDPDTAFMAVAFGDQ